MRVLLFGTPNGPSQSTWSLLKDQGIDVSQRCPADLTFERLMRPIPTVIILEILEGEDEGLNLFKTIQRLCADIPIVVLSVRDDPALAFSFVRAGAQDYLVKGRASDDSLVRCIQYAVERHHLVLAQKGNELRTRVVLEHAYDAFITLDSNMRITDWNAAAERTFGWDRQEMLGRKLSSIVPPHMQRHFTRTISSYFQNQKNGFFRSTREITAEKRMGIAFPAEFGIFRIGSDNDSKNTFCAFVRDITMFKKTHEELEAIVNERTRELLRSNEELYQFAKVASHDLQEPLRAVEGFATLLVQTSEGKLDKDGVEFIEFILDGVQRMKELIQSILIHSRVTSSDCIDQRADCNRALEQVLANLRDIIDETQASFEIDELPEVSVEHSQVVQLFQNLISNSLKYKSNDPPSITIGARKTLGKWLFSVSDNGIGIESEYREKIFDMFSRLHSKGKYPGTGIGLAICKKIVTAHGGAIWVESSVGIGSIFMFTLPALPEKRTKMMKDTIKLLLAEDTPSDVRLCQEALKRSHLNYELTVVSDGVEVLERLTEAKTSPTPIFPDILLLDLNMPRKNGHAVLEEIKADPILTTIPVVLLTVSERDEDVLEALGTKMNYYLAKPITTEKISYLLKTIHELHSASDGTVLHCKEETHVRLVLAGNPHTSIMALSRLADDPHDKVRARVAENPRITPELQAKLAGDHAAEVRVRLCENSAIGTTVLEQLAVDDNADVRLAASCNPAISKELLERLIEDENVYVCASAKKGLAERT